MSYQFQEDKRSVSNLHEQTALTKNHDELIKGY